MQTVMAFTGRNKLKRASVQVSSLSAGLGDTDASKRLSRSAENILSPSSHQSKTASLPRPSSPQTTSKFSTGFKGLFHRKKEIESAHPESNPTLSVDSPPVSYASSLHDLPERPRAFNRVLQQIRARPNMRKSNSDGKNLTPKLPALRTKSDSSDTEATKEENRQKRRYFSERDADSRSAHDDSDAAENPTGTPCYGSDMDDVDTGLVHDQQQRTKDLLNYYLRKLEKTKELIKAEQKVKDENVTEYLSLTEHADKQQATRIKQVFEKKNQKSNQTMGQLQRKLEMYQKKVLELMEHGAQGPKKPLEVLQGMQQGLRGVKDNIKEGITGFGGLLAKHTPSPAISKGSPDLDKSWKLHKRTAVVAKPREFAKNIKSKFGSADNIDTLGLEVDQEAPKSKTHWFTSTPSQEEIARPKSLSDGDDTNSLTSGSLANGNMSREEMDNNYSHPLASTINHIQETVRELLANQTMLQQSVDDIQVQMQQQYQYFSQLIQEDRYKSDRLQEQLTDLTDLHQHAVNNLQQELGAVEERLDYRGEERLRDLQDQLEQYQTRVSKIEVAQQHQQVITLEGYGNGNARVLATRLINVVLAILAVALVFVATIANSVGPFISTRGRLLVTVTVCIVSFYLWRRQDLVEHFILTIGDNYRTLFNLRQR